jgi:hypothetical protein
VDCINGLLLGCEEIGNLSQNQPGMSAVIFESPHLLGGPMLPIERTVRAGDLHQDVVTLVQIAFSETDADRELDASIGFDTISYGPAGRAAAFLMEHVIG